MFLNFFIELRNIKVPVSLREYLSLLDCLDKNVISFKVENFYYLSRASLIKNEKHIDRFDLVFSKVFKGIEDISLEDLLNKVDIPKEWVKKLSEKLLTPEEMEEIKSLGGFDKPLTYRFKPTVYNNIRLGSLVLIPLGKRKINGIVWSFEEDIPEPEGLSVAVILNAFSAPVGDFITKLNVPSPEPTILAVMS